LVRAGVEWGWGKGRVFQLMLFFAASAAPKVEDFIDEFVLLTSG
jgi:hypothetical protein